MENIKSPDNPSDRIRKLVEQENIKVGRKENEQDTFATLVTLKADSLKRPGGLIGRILEINYDDPEPYLVITVHGYKAKEKILLKDITSIEKNE